jgi:hypothetical protein
MARAHLELLARSLCGDLEVGIGPLAREAQTVYSVEDYKRQRCLGGRWSLGLEGQGMARVKRKSFWTLTYQRASSQSGLRKAPGVS